jgi:hypothetical protein
MIVAPEVEIGSVMTASDLRNWPRCQAIYFKFTGINFGHCHTLVAQLLILSIAFQSIKMTGGRYGSFRDACE